MQKRTVRLPHPASSRKLEVRGPAQRCRTDDQARRAFDTALTRAAQLEHGIYDDGDLPAESWSVWWGDRPHVENGSIVVWLWPEDSDGGERSAELLRETFEKAGFRVTREDRPTRPPTLHTRPYVVRAGEALVGCTLYPDLDYIRERGREAPQVDRCFDFRVQRCPSCGARVQSRGVVWGLPTADASFRLSLGEVEALGCMPGSDNAVCPACEETFYATPEEEA